MDLSNKVVVIMGASSGMGAAISRKLAADGAKLVIAARRLDRLEKIQAEFPEGQVLIKQADVTKIDNNAGIMPQSPLIDGKRDEWQRTIDTNINGVLNGIAAALPQMVKQGSGHVIATDSVGGHVIFPNGAVYSGTKFAVRAIMDGLRKEQAENNIKTTIVSPGATETDLYKTNDPELDQQGHKMMKQMGALQPEQIADAVEFAIGTKANMSVSEILVRPTKQSD
ncbi:SDR family oxidoreductase [Companilactobacillus kimchiensis]|uniref:Oxidoreductase, short chain dehydrogenase reductase family protein n=1 Tax=Companilactobacillus kimchiensis TaxID=993692 RepID=A0A0R2LML5_9LACO|nr:SDR family oxidoreductase [Companilactobacillus kimchiensis]KRO00706.1 oxidoreductase, short chain dehydrogenase reductase family protein [Companilactobacillus kimchiensis]